MVKITLAIIAAVTLVVLGLGAGWLVWGRWLWQPGLVGGPGMAWNRDDCDGSSSGTPGGLLRRMMDQWTTPRQIGSEMMQGWSQAGSELCSESNVVTAPEGQIGKDEAQLAVMSYISGWGTELGIAELMEFEHNYYAIIQEHDTGMGAMELLVDKVTGYVTPEIGPNMMWNTRYGMHSRQSMMGISSPTNELSETEALAAAQQWLDEHRVGEQTEGHADPFYGYYTIHTLQDDQIEGMLSVHGQTGQVWYHTWHGEFVQMLEEEGLDH